MRTYMTRCECDGPRCMYVPHVQCRCLCLTDILLYLAGHDAADSSYSEKICIKHITGRFGQPFRFGQSYAHHFPHFVCEQSMLLIQNRIYISSDTIWCIHYAVASSIHRRDTFTVQSNIKTKLRHRRSQPSLIEYNIFKRAQHLSIIGALCVHPLGVSAQTEWKIKTKTTMRRIPIHSMPLKPEAVFRNETEQGRV